MADAPAPQTDVSRPSALPSARLLSQQHQHQQAALADQGSTEYLDAVEEDWNRRIDADVEALVDGMADLVGLASVRPLSVFSFGCLG
jgi:mediator of RNA polymerase II transcription subunit 22